MGHVLPSNRVASLTTFIVGLAGCATALAGFWHNPVTNEVAMIAGSVGTLAGPLSHVVGSWFWDRTPAGQAQALASAEQPAAPDDPDPSEWLGNRSPTPDPVGDPPAAPQPPAPTPAPPPAA